MDLEISSRFKKYTKFVDSDPGYGARGSNFVQGIPQGQSLCKVFTMVKLGLREEEVLAPGALPSHGRPPQRKSAPVSLGTAVGNSTGELTGLFLIVNGGLLCFSPAGLNSLLPPGTLLFWSEGRPPRFRYLAAHFRKLLCFSRRSKCLRCRRSVLTSEFCRIVLERLHHELNSTETELFRSCSQCDVKRFRKRRRNAHVLARMLITFPCGQGPLRESFFEVPTRP